MSDARKVFDLLVKRTRDGDVAAEEYLRSALSGMSVTMPVETLCQTMEFLAEKRDDQMDEFVRQN